MVSQESLHKIVEVVHIMPFFSLESDSGLACGGCKQYTDMFYKTRGSLQAAHNWTNLSYWYIKCWHVLLQLLRLCWTIAVQKSLFLMRGGSLCFLRYPTGGDTTYDRGKTSNETFHSLRWGAFAAPRSQSHQSQCDSPWRRHTIRQPWNRTMFGHWYVNQWLSSCKNNCHRSETWLSNRLPCYAIGCRCSLPDSRLPSNHLLIC